MKRMRRRGAALIFVACAAIGCAHAGAGADAPSDPRAAAGEPFAHVTEIMIKLEDVRGIYLPKRPPLVQLDDGAFGRACLEHLRTTSWYAGDAEEWRASGQAKAEVAFAAECALTFAFYERGGDRVVIKRDAFARLPRVTQLEMVAHELVHALQAHGLPAPPSDMTSDARLALAALVEGDATVTALAFELKLAGKPLASEISRLWMVIGAGEARSLRDPRFFAVWLGARFVLDLYQRGGFAAVDEAFAHPPTSTAQIVHANRYFEPQAVTRVSSRVPLPPPFAPFATVVRGEYGLRASLSRCAAPPVAMELGADWDGDELTVARAPPSSQHMYRWVTAWRSEVAAKQFSDVVRASGPCLLGDGVSIAARGRVAVIVSGPDAAVRQKHAKEVLADVLAPRP